MKTVFLGGTCNNSDWREKLIPLLTINFFNPVVKDWTTKAQKEERRQKKVCNIHLYVITKEMKGVFSIAEVVDSAHNNSVKTVFYIVKDGFDKAELKSLDAVSKMVSKLGAITVIGEIEDVANVINNLELLSKHSGLSYGEAIEALESGYMVARRGWNGKGMFVFKQVPSEIGLDIIPKMTSVPNSVKEYLIKNSIELNYSNQMAIVQADGRVDSWVASSSDTFAKDWQIK